MALVSMLCGYSQLSSLSLKDKRLLFVPLRPFLKCSKRLIAQIGSTLKSAHQENLRIGICFPPQFWQEYRQYYTTYKTIRELLNNLRQTNDEFMEYCKELRGAARQSLDSLLLLPVQRVGQYDSFLTNLMDQTSKTHPDYRNIVTASSMVNKMVKEQQEEVSQAENDARLLQVQERFPGDELHLFDANCFKSQFQTPLRISPYPIIPFPYTKCPVYILYIQDLESWIFVHSLI
ncbi:hypothetical protein BSL78_01797 [Apostichopus japonicus]|uniref:DH domain-containing protein n=1 Tax=Stichopus japonicus TaxID=307972 RepID=A0A2G8LLU8_STIJA|nr:hypothetical protein BSL78_01797 [Apostichopus japonicus]